MTKLTIESQDASLENRRRRDIIAIGTPAVPLNAWPVLVAALPATAPEAVFVAVGGSRRKFIRGSLLAFQCFPTQTANPS